MTEHFLNYNGNILPADQPLFTAENRAFRYGDAVFETIRMMNGEILFFDRHLERLHRSMQLLGMEHHPDLSLHQLYLSMRHLDQSNKLKGNARIRLQVFRNDGGLYTPKTDSVSYLIEALPLLQKEFALNESGLKVEIYEEIKKPVSRLSNLKSANALYYVMAGLHKRRLGIDDCFVLNTDGRIAEAISSNVFLVRGKELITPSLSEACVSGILRDVLISMVEEEGATVLQQPVAADDLLSADEIFLTDVINGIRWVGAFRNKRYFNTRSRMLLQQINERQIKKV
jgi:branched-chain amino acid aminotransferase